MSADEKGDGLGGLLTELGVVAPDSNPTVTLSSDQQAIINAYRSGKMEEAEFQQKLADDPGLSDYIRSRSVADDEPPTR